MNVIRLTLLFAVVVFASGCYRYAPVEQGTVPPGEKVRARLTSSGMEEARRYFGSRVTQVEGPLVRWDGNGLAVLTEIHLQVEGFPATLAADTVRFLPGHYSLVEGRELNGRRTAFLAGGIVAGMAGALSMANLIDPGGEEGEGKDPPDDPDALLLFSIPFTIFR